MHYAKFLKLQIFFKVAKLVELAERVKIVTKSTERVRHRQSLLNRLNRAKSCLWCGPGGNRAERNFSDLQMNTLTYTITIISYYY